MDKETYDEYLIETGQPCPVCNTQVESTNGDLCSNCDGLGYVPRCRMDSRTNKTPIVIDNSVPF